MKVEKINQFINQNNKQDDIYDIVVVVGPDHSEFYVDYLTTALAKTGLNCKILGNGKTEVPIEAIQEVLKRCSPDTLIHYFGHGYSHKKFHTIQITNTDAKTEDLLGLHKNTFSSISISSCQSGAGKNAVKVLGERQPVIFHSDAENTTLIAMNVERILMQARFCATMLKQEKRRPNQYDYAEFSVFLAETFVLAEQVKGKVESFTVRAPDKAVGSKDAQRHMERKLKKLRKEFRIKKLGQQQEDFIDFNKTSIITEAVITRYLEHAVMIKIYTEKDSKKLSEYISKYLELGGNPNAKLINNDTLLHLICDEGRTKVAKLLLENGAKIDAVDKDDRTPLHNACSRGKTEVTELLLENKANINAETKNGWTPLHLACGKNHIKAIKLLLENGAKIDAVDKDGRTPLHLACIKGNVEAIKLLLKNGAKIDAVDKNGRTPLYFACQQGDNETVKLLLQSKADTSKGMFGVFTPLMATVLSGRGGVLYILLQHIIDPNELKKTASSKIAKEFCKENLVETLDKYKEFLDKSAIEMAYGMGRNAIAEKIENRIKELKKEAILNKHVNPSKEVNIFRN